MDATAVIALALGLLAVVLVVAQMRKSPGTTAAPVALDTETLSATLRRQMSEEVDRTIRDSVNVTVAEALISLNNVAEKQREAFVESAAKAMVDKGDTQFRERATEIDTTIRQVTDKFAERLEALTGELDKLRQTNDRQYNSVEQAVAALAQRTENLKEVLSSSQKRGQWGERVVEDMLRAAGFVENVNYAKQDVNEAGGRPDYKFMMPPNRVLFMDVKFPLDKYAEHFSAENDSQRNVAKTEFVRAVKGHIDTLAKRDYVNNAKEEALDYVLMFLPNESISGFVHEADPGLLDHALSKKVVLCSPLSLYSFLVVIRQATESFHTEQTAADIMVQINKFNGEWNKYVEAVDDVKKTFEKLIDKIDDIGTGGTRFKKLTVPVRDIEKMRKRSGVAGIEASPAGEIAPVDDLD